jgi:hypothetical protein
MGGGAGGGPMMITTGGWVTDIAGRKVRTRPVAANASVLRAALTSSARARYGRATLCNSGAP